MFKLVYIRWLLPWSVHHHINFVYNRLPAYTNVCIICTVFDTQDPKPTLKQINTQQRQPHNQHGISQLFCIYMAKHSVWQVPKKKNSVQRLLYLLPSTTIPGYSWLMKCSVCFELAIPWMPYENTLAIRTTTTKDGLNKMLMNENDCRHNRIFSQYCTVFTHFLLLLLLLLVRCGGWVTTNMLHGNMIVIPWKTCRAKIDVILNRFEKKKYNSLSLFS